ncbi:MAG: respiratory nitrate reductase subunit gamma [Chloroflexi bacterium]|nr:respiratory nitrate reductase subunit gamma [Chloroflexota bacterium]MCL5107443.1 respiratory nitrate reductase subunit gamma [Chloroflexota bacterium]
MWALQGLTYLAVLVFVFFVARRAARYASAPMHLRWELYPVAHEVDKEYGGSFMEEMDWWTKPRRTSFFNTIKAMAIEILFVKTLWENSRKLWYVSYPFHGGLYVVIAYLALLVLGSLVNLFGGQVAANADWWQAALYWLTVLAGVVGMVAVSVGCLGLLAMRTFSDGLRRYSTPADYFNLVFILAVAVTGLYGWAVVDPGFSQQRAFVVGLLSLKAVALSPIFVANATLFALFLTYLPFTHMTHFVGKFFNYHNVRWDDTPNASSQANQRALGEALNKPISWPAPHIGGGAGQKWVDAVTREVNK